MVGSSNLVCVEPRIIQQLDGVVDVARVLVEDQVEFRQGLVLQLQNRDFARISAYIKVCAVVN